MTVRGHGMVVTVAVIIMAVIIMAVIAPAMAVWVAVGRKCKPLSKPIYKPIGVERKAVAVVVRVRWVVAMIVAMISV